MRKPDGLQLKSLTFENTVQRNCMLAKFARSKTNTFRLLKRSLVFIIITNLHFITSAGAATTSSLKFTSLGANKWPETKPDDKFYFCFFFGGGD